MSSRPSPSLPKQAFWRRGGWLRPRRGLRLTAPQLVFGLLLLFLLAGYAYLGGHLILYRQPVLRLPPFTRVGPTPFRLLQARLGNRLCYTCGLTKADVLLIQTSRPRFEDLMAYSRRIASPTDRDLVAVFVQDTVPGQPWQELARRSLYDLHRHRAVPANWLARLDVSPSGHQGSSISWQLTDLDALLHQPEFRMWTARLRPDSDTLSETLARGCDTCRRQVVKLPGHRLAATDGAAHSPMRRGLREHWGLKP